MSDIVLDASIVATWCFSDERAADTDALLRSLSSGACAHVPGLWHWEVANLFVSGLRRGRLQLADVARYQALLATLPIATDLTAQAIAGQGLTALAASYGLTAYDASYLDLAVRMRLPLATRDAALAAAAVSAGAFLAL